MPGRYRSGGITMVSRTLLAAGSLLALISASPAFAQGNATAASQNGQGSAAATTPNNQEAGIVVTAQLREQRQIDVPFALTAYTGRQLDQLGVQEFEDLARYTPG